MEGSTPTVESAQRMGEPGTLEERVVLFTCALRGPKGLALIEGLRSSAQAGARHYGSQVLALSARDRHGRLFRAFGVRRDALERLEERAAEAAPELQGLIKALVPDSHVLLSAPGVPGVAPRSARYVLAARLLREALR